MWVQVEQEQLVVHVQLFVVEVVAHFEIVGFTTIGFPGFPILDYICLLTNHGSIIDVGAYCC